MINESNKILNQKLNNNTNIFSLLIIIMKILVMNTEYLSKFKV